MGSLWNRSGTVERYADDLRAVGAKAYFFQGGTTTRLTVFRDSSDSIAFPDPVVADANGRWPDIFVPYIKSYDVLVKSADDVQLTFTAEIPNVNPAGDATAIDIPPALQKQLVQTGMIHAEFTYGAREGYVRLNGKTIGHDFSGASERANIDTRNLYIYLWNLVSDVFCPVLPGGRGSSAESDFDDDKKTMGLPDMRGLGFMGLDDMGNIPADRFTGLSFHGGVPTLVGSVLGENAVKLTLAQIPVHSHGGATSTPNATGHQHLTAGESANHQHLTGGNFTSSDNAIVHHHAVPDLTVGTLNLGGFTGGAQPIVVSVAYGSPSATHSTNDVAVNHNHVTTVGGYTDIESASHVHAVSQAITNDVHTHTFATGGAGGNVLTGTNDPFNNTPFTRLVTWMIKL